MAADSTSSPIEAVVFDIGRVLVEWRIGALYEKLIADPDRLAWFLAHVVTEQWHFQHDQGRPLARMIATASGVRWAMRRIGSVIFKRGAQG